MTIQSVGLKTPQATSTAQGQGAAKFSALVRQAESTKAAGTSIYSISGDEITLNGKASDFSITYNGDNTISVSKRSKNGFGNSSNPVKINIESISKIKFRDGGTEIGIAPLKGLKPATMGVRYIDVEDGFKTNSLYRSFNKHKDFIRAGDGNDQFRAGANLEGDVFYGGGGVDTLYLTGKESDYKFEKISDPSLGNMIKVTKVGDDSNFMFIGEDVEYIRFVGEQNKLKGRNNHTREDIKKDKISVADLLYGKTFEIRNINGNTYNGTKFRDKFSYDFSDHLTRKEDILVDGKEGIDQLDIFYYPIAEDYILKKHKFVFSTEDNSFTITSFNSFGANAGDDDPFKATVTAKNIEIISFYNGRKFTVEFIKKHLDTDGYFDFTKYPSNV